MSEKKCIGERLDNAVDSVLGDIEREVAAAKGVGSVTEDKFDEIMSQISSIKDINDKIKCMIESIPKSNVNPEEIIEEIK